MGKWPVSIFYAIAVACDFKRLQSILVGEGFFNRSNNRDQLWAVSVVRNKKVKNLKVITTFYMYPFLHTNLQLKQFTTFISHLLSLNFLVMQFLKKQLSLIAAWSSTFLLLRNFSFTAGLNSCTYGHTHVQCQTFRSTLILWFQHVLKQLSSLSPLWPT